MRMRTLIALAVITFLFSIGASMPTGISESQMTSDVQLTKPAGIDLDVTYINRAPLHSRYSVLYTADGRPYLQPGTEYEKRWPAQGELVTFTAHVKNKGTIASGTFTFKWFVDGTEVATGTHGSLSPGQEATESYQWTWAHPSNGEQLLGEHTIKFVVDPNNSISETYESNNFIEDRTDAISLYLAVTAQLYTALETPTNSKWPFSAEDWLQKQIAAMNAAFVRSVYPSLPNGIPERVRLDQIFVTSSAPAVGTGLDGGFFMSADDRYGNSYYDPVGDVSGALIHELTHQLGIIDMYNLDADLEVAQVTDQFGQPVQMEFSSGTLSHGLMNDPGIRPPIYDEHTALALNANKGYRRGYYGEYLYDISNQVRLRVVDNMGASAAGVTVTLYQRSFGPALFGSVKGTIDNAPEFSGITDAYGVVELTNRPVTPVTTNTGHILHDNPFGPINVVGNNDEFILELRKDDYQEFRWLDVTAFNFAMWQNGSDLAVINVGSHLPSTQPVLPPLNLTGLQESGVVKLQWSPSASSVSGYNVYRTDNSSSQYQRVATYLQALGFSEPYPSSWRATTYVVTAVDSQWHESGFSNPFYAFRLENPSALVVDEQDNRVVLDPQNGYALLYQLGNGTVFDTRGSVDYHLEFSRYLARDADGHLIISHPGDFYSSRHSIRVTDQDANPLFEFGTQGSGAGQFQTPAGVAAWGQSCGIQGPYAVDNHTLLLLHLDNSFDGAQGEAGSPSGVSFADGKYAQAVTMDSSDTLTYPTTGNLNRTQGAIEFWIRPYWNGNDNQSYTFFEVGNDWFNRMRIMKDGANNLRFMLWNSTTEYGVAYNVGQWKAGEWHHVAATWMGTNIALSVDGQQVANSSTANMPDSLGATIYVGSAAPLGQQANADIDELRISDIPRIGNSDTCTYRILVVDSGNNRIQAFDGRGNFVATYGSFGSGAGQFKNPQGLAVDASGNVMVADSGNNRLQVLSFNGSSFGFVRTITANLNGPMGIATDASDRILIADTGNNKIKVLSVQGELLAEYTSPNDGNEGTFNQPRGVAVDGNGRIIVADTGNKRIVSILDEPPVKVLSVTRADPDPTSAASVNFTLSFSRSVTGVDTTAPFSDFALTITDSVTGASITNVTGSGSTYTVTVNTGSENGTIRLDVVDNNTIIDSAGNPLGGVKLGDGNFTSGEAYTIRKNITFTNCADQTEVPESECNALVALYNNTNGDAWTKRTGWLQSNTPCSWYGVVCDNTGSIVQLNLNHNHLIGSIPAQISDLTHLVSLNLGQNNLSGAFPAQIGNLTNLTYLNCEYCRFTGSIPPQIGNLTSLETLILGSNELTGSIPAEFGNLSNLNMLILNTNHLTGSIPTELGSITNLTRLDLGHNQLTGSIPPQLSQLANLVVLDLLDNQLTGTIPPELGSLAKLDSLYLEDNQFTGTMPPQLGNLSKLIVLHLENNQLTGSIPTQIGNLIKLHVLSLNGNQLTGSIPNEIGNLTNLDSLFLQDNKLKGEFPASIVNLTNMVIFQYDCWITSTNPTVIAFLENRSPGWQSKVCPIVSSITPSDPDPTSATSVSFAVAFSESVTGVDTNPPFHNFALIGDAITEASILSVSGSGETYIVVVNTGYGNGTLRLDVVDDNTIIDSDGNPLGGDNLGDGNFVDGEAYSIVPNVNVVIGGQPTAGYHLPVNGELRANYANLDSGPVRVISTNNAPIVTALRDLWWNGSAYTSSIQLMGLPQNLLSDTYIFPSYNNVSLNDQLRFGNVGNSNTTVTVTIGGIVRGTYNLQPNQREKVNYAGLDSGPVIVKSSNGVPIIVSIRDAWINNGATSSFSQLMGLPQSLLSDTYIFPSYNNVNLSDQLRFGNVGNAPTTVTITIGGQVMGTYDLQPNQRDKATYPNLDSGPVIVHSSNGVPIIASLREAWINNGVTTSYFQMMGLPQSQLSDKYVFPSYDNVTLSGQLRFGNVGNTNTTVTVTVGGIVKGTYNLAPNQRQKVSYAGLNDGPIVVQSSNGVPIIAALRDAWLVNGVTTSFSQLMGLPAGQLSTIYVFPSYNNVTYDNQLRIGVP